MFIVLYSVGSPAYGGTASAIELHECVDEAKRSRYYEFMPPAKITGAVVLCLFITCSCAFAEIITLTSGQTIEAQIIERTDAYIKVTFQGIPLTYYKDEIAHIEGESMPFAHGNDTIESADSAGVWQAWSESISAYFDTMSRILDKSEAIAAQSNAALNEAMSKDERETGRAIIEKTGESLALLIDEMRILGPPQDLKTYHEKTIEAHEYKKKTNDAFLADDSDAASRYFLMSITAETEGIKELRRVYAEKGASPELIHALDSVIADYKAQMD